MSATKVVCSLSRQGAPTYLCALFEALQFDRASFAGLQRLDSAEWDALLQWCGPRQLVLMLPHVCAEALPPAIRLRIEKCQKRYSVRFSRLKQQLVAITRALDSAGIEFALLKGLSHSPALTANPLLRAQGDIDLWIPGLAVYKGEALLRRMGYVPFDSAKSRHLSPMRLPSNWSWRGDLFDPEMPVSVELHYELWSSAAERIPVTGLAEFWSRRVQRDFGGATAAVLCDEDLLGFAALHLLLHVLHGEFPAQRAWEIGNFLNARSGGDEFWTSWRASHPKSLSRLEAVVFELVRKWFACALPDLVEQEIKMLPRRVTAWLEASALSPVLHSFRANKDEIGLHLALVPPADRAAIVIRRLFPLRGTELRSFRRAAFHVQTLLPSAWEGVRWLLSR